MDSLATDKNPKWNFNGHHPPSMATTHLQWPPPTFNGHHPLQSRILERPLP